MVWRENSSNSHSWFAGGASFSTRSKNAGQPWIEVMIKHESRIEWVQIGWWIFDKLLRIVNHELRIAHSLSVSLRMDVCQGNEATTRLATYRRLLNASLRFQGTRSIWEFSINFLLPIGMVGNQIEISYLIVLTINEFCTYKINVEHRLYKKKEQDNNVH